jgi:CubicO group peptidase (beta-lactamase class C family)
MASRVAVKRLVYPLLLALTVPARAADAGAVLDAAMAGTRVPAMGVAVLRQGHIAAMAVRGVRRNDAADRVQVNDPWHIGSDAKAMTAVLIARLVERGVLAWDTRLDALLPDLAPVMQPRYARATLVDLLSHHAGLPHDLVDADRRAVLFGNRSGTTSDQRLRYIAAALADPPEGEGFHYSNTGYLVAAAVAERATGQAWEDLLQHEVLAPLGITHARFGTTITGEPQGHRDGHPTGPGQTNPPFFAPAGGLVLPLDEWAAFCLDQLAGAQGQGALLKDYRPMQTAIGRGGYGMGWEVLRDYRGQAGPVLLHAGSDTNWYALAVLLPRRGAGVLVTANAGPDMGGDAAARAVVARELEDHDGLHD